MCAAVRKQKRGDEKRVAFVQVAIVLKSIDASFTKGDEDDDDDDGTAR